MHISYQMTMIRSTKKYMNICVVSDFLVNYVVGYS